MEILSVQEEIETIRALEGPVLSIYLNTEPRKGDWKIEYKNGMKQLEMELLGRENVTKEEVQLFRELQEQAGKLMLDLQPQMRRSLVCFLTKEQTIVKRLQTPILTGLYYRQRPVLDQLEQLAIDYPLTGIIHLQWDLVTVLHTSLGELKGVTDFQLDIEKEDWKRYKGLAYGGVISSSANHRHKFERRLQENRQRWFRELIPELNALSQQQGWAGVYLLGVHEMIHELEKHLQVEVLAEVPRILAGKNPDEVLEIVFTEIENE